MRSGRMARRLVATAGMGAILAMGVVLAACRSAGTGDRHEDGHGDGRPAGHAGSAGAGADGEGRSTRPAATCSRPQS